MGISLNAINDKMMRCPIRDGSRCMGMQCMLWRWNNDGLPDYKYQSPDVVLSGEWVKEGEPESFFDEGALDYKVGQRWKHPPTGYCGLVKE